MLAHISLRPGGLSLPASAGRYAPVLGGALAGLLRFWHSVLRFVRLPSRFTCLIPPVLSALCLLLANRRFCRSLGLSFYPWTVHCVVCHREKDT